MYCARIPPHTVTNIAALVAAMFFLCGFKPLPPQAKLSIGIQHYNGSSLLQLDSATYKNAFGQAYTVSRFRYYIGDISLKKKDGAEYTTHNYYLVDEEDAASKKIQLDIPPGKYTSISFLLGVDSAHNCSGAQTGALDPVNGMFWMWSTGYIFLKLEGHADASASPGHIFEYHIGGYRQPVNCIRTITLNLNKGFNIAAGTKQEINLKADVSEILKTPVAIDFSKLSSVTDLHNATTIANNYADMFSVIVP